MSRRSVAKPAAAKEWRTPSGQPATSDFYRAVQEDVMTWWREHQRTDLPWRAPPKDAAPSSSAATTASADSSVRPRTPLYNPYEVWVSEVMSQQTRMETVIPYFHRWMKKFPTIEALAASTEDEVKAVWAGMGYYRRALYLHKGAQHLLEWKRAQPTSPAAPPMPSTQRELLKVPGIGPYTSAAVASLCFGEAVCSVDGNVIRVLSRLRGEQGFDPKVPANVKAACAWGQELMGNTPQTASVVCQDPSALNQGLMEIGASVCRPNAAPLCERCPLQRHCRAYALRQSGEIAAIEGVIPTRAAATAKRSAKEVCVVHEVESGSNDDAGAMRRFVVVRRPPGGLLAGMLEFPTVSAGAADNGDDDVEDDGAEAVPTSHALATLPAWKRRAKTPSANFCGEVRHIFSHIVMDVTVLHVRWPADVNVGQLISAIVTVVDDHCDGDCNPAPAATRTCLMTEEELRGAAPSRLMLKVLQQLSAGEGKRKRCSAKRKTDSPVRSPSPKTVKARS